MTTPTQPTPPRTLIFQAGSPAHKLLLELIKGTFDSSLASVGEAVDKEKVQEVVDEVESFPVLVDIPEDPDIVIEELNTKILVLEAELEEHRRTVNREAGYLADVVKALLDLGTIPEPVVAPEPAKLAETAPGGFLDVFRA
jgi:hypothetical protein